MWHHVLRARSKNSRTKCYVTLDSLDPFPVVPQFWLLPIEKSALANVRGANMVTGAQAFQRWTISPATSAFYLLLLIVLKTTVLLVCSGQCSGLVIAAPGFDQLAAEQKATH